MNKNTKIIISCFLFLLFGISYFCRSQQLPVFTQYKSNQFLINPALTGTKRNVDIRLNYRNQWTGFDDAPITKCFSLNSRIYDGTAGLGGFIYQDETGPTRRTNYNLSYAYHMRFSDVEFSLGLAGSMTQYRLDGARINIHNSGDPAIDKSLIDNSWSKDVAGGLYLYNDRFSLGLSVSNLLKSAHQFYQNDIDTSKKGFVYFQPHIYLTLGYNFSQNPDYLWEHTILVSYITGVPMLIDYTLRLHYMKKFFLGTSIRWGDAIAIHAGVIFRETFQMSYSYDLITSELRQTNFGTHEVMVVYSINTGKKKKTNKDFQKRKYQYLF